MLAKYLKIQIIIFLFASLPGAYAQNNVPALDTVNIRINSYLRTIHLNILIKATGFSASQTVRHYGPQGEISLKNVQVLTLQPDNTFAGPLEFAAAWRKLQQKLDNKQNIYWQLFFKLAEFSSREPGSLAILITTSKPRIYSILVYYDKMIRIDGPENEIKGISNINMSVDPEKDFACSNYIPHQPYSNDLQERLVAGISKFLTLDALGRVDKNVDIKLQHEHESFVKFTASNLHGKITHKFYEVVELYLSLASVNQNTVNIGYNFIMHFGSERYSVSGYANDYEDGLQKHADEMGQFNRKLSDLIQSITNPHEHNK